MFTTHCRTYIRLHKNSTLEIKLQTVTTSGNTSHRESDPQCQPIPSEVWGEYTYVAAGLTCTVSGRVASFFHSEWCIILAISSAVWPIDPTKSGLPHDPISRVSPVKACRIVTIYNTVEHLKHL